MLLSLSNCQLSSAEPPVRATNMSHRWAEDKCYTSVVWYETCSASREPLFETDGDNITLLCSNTAQNHSQKHNTLDYFMTVESAFSDKPLRDAHRSAQLHYSLKGVPTRSIVVMSNSNQRIKPFNLQCNYGS